MGIFDFFKPKDRISEKATEKLDFQDIPSWIIKKREVEQILEKKAVTNLKNIIFSLILELKEKKEAIQAIDIGEKREHEKLKNVVIENQIRYQALLDIFIQELGELRNSEKEKNLESFMVQLNEAILGFEKKSKVPFERTTILIGKEMAAVRKSLSGFFKNLNSLFENHKSIIFRLQSMKNIDCDISELQALADEKQDILQAVQILEFKKNELELKEKEIEQRLEKGKVSSEYIQEKEIRKEASLKKKQIEKKIAELKAFIDFKSLEASYHSNEKKMRVIKRYESDFRVIFDKSKNEDNESFLSILDESKKEAISSQIKEITGELQNIEQVLNSKDSLIESVNLEKAALVSELNELALESLKNTKRLEKTAENQNLTKKKVEQILNSMNVELLGL